MPHERTIEEMLSDWEERERRYQRRKAIAWRVALAAAGALAAARIAAGMIYDHPWPGAATGAWNTYLLLIPFAAQGGVLAVLMRGTAQRDVLEQLSRLDDVRAIGPLVYALDADSSAVPVLVTKAFTRLLPMVQADDQRHLTADQRAALYRSIAPGVRHTNTTPEQMRAYRIAALRALEQIGDAQALPVVRQLAGYLQEPAVRTAALACLPALVAHAERSQSSQTLLRPSARPAGNSDLLQPAAQTATVAQELLRGAAKST